jgi:hypothetical protein
MSARFTLDSALQVFLGTFWFTNARGGISIMDVHLSQLWTLATIVILFQLIAFGWRLSRESEPAKSNASWLPPADFLNLLSILVSICTVFVLPALGIAVYEAPAGFALSLILLAGYPFAIAGHYRLFRMGAAKERVYCTLQEALAICLTCVAVGVFMYRYQLFAGPQAEMLNWLLPLLMAWIILGNSVFELAKSKRRTTPQVLTMSWMFPPVVAGVLHWSKRSRTATAKAAS